MTIAEAIAGIKESVLGKDVRQSICDGIDAINTDAESLDDDLASLNTLKNEVYEKFTSSSPSNAEIVAARTDINDKTYDTLKARLDAMQTVEETNASDINAVNGSATTYIFQENYWQEAISSVQESIDMTKFSANKDLASAKDAYDLTKAIEDGLSESKRGISSYLKAVTLECYVEMYNSGFGSYTTELEAYEDYVPLCAFVYDGFDNGSLIYWNTQNSISEKNGTYYLNHEWYSPDEEFGNEGTVKFVVLYVYIGGISIVA